MSPMEAKKANKYTLWSNQYESAENKKQSLSNIKIYKFQIGDRVKISYLKIFGKMEH